MSEMWLFCCQRTTAVFDCQGMLRVVVPFSWRATGCGDSECKDPIQVGEKSTKPANFKRDWPTPMCPKSPKSEKSISHFKFQSLILLFLEISRCQRCLEGQRCLAAPFSPLPIADLQTHLAELSVQVYRGTDNGTPLCDLVTQGFKGEFPSQTFMTCRQDLSPEQGVLLQI